MEKTKVEVVSGDLTSRLRNFIEKYYHKELLTVVKKGGLSLIIDFLNIAKFDRDIADNLLENPTEIIEYFESAIKEFDLPEETVIVVRIVNLPKSQHIRIRDIRSKHLGKLISTDGLIRQASDIRPKMTVGIFECGGCGNQLIVEQRESKLREPIKCQCGRKGKFRLIDKKMVDMQRLLIEESPESLGGGEQPKRIAVFLSEDLLDPKLEKRRYPGNKIRIVGIIREVVVPLRTGGQSTKFDLLIDTNSLETVEEEFEEIEITLEDKKIIEDLAKDPYVFQKLVHSLVPSIYGHETIKEALVLQLFGGVKKVRSDGTRMRGDMHVFLVGDPGSGKSEMLKYIVTLAPKARYISGKGATSAGLTAAVVKDEFMRGWALEAGALVLANKGICAVDELDKMTPEDRSAMHEALEQQTITISKANIQATLRAETSVLAAANPKFGRFDPFSPLAAQIDLPSTLINRFDLIFPVRDIPNIELDKKIAKHILELQKDFEAVKADIDPKLMRKYIAYAKQNCFPKLTNAAQEVIEKFYIDLRSAAALDEAEIKAIPISARQLQALVRMAEASAKIRLSSKVSKKDAERAIALLKYCMQAVGTDPETGKFDIDRITTGITATQRSRISIIKQIIRDLEGKVGKMIPISEISKAAEEEGIEASKAEELISNLIKKGDLFEPRHGVVQRTG